MGKKRERKLKKRFKIEKSNTDYDFQLRRKPNLWWLLLLLLPSVLLIPLKKDITVMTQLDGQPEPFVDVQMNYTGSYLFYNKHFFAEIPRDTIQQTDSLGVTIFKDLGYSVYSLIFHFKKPVDFSVGNECYDSAIEKRVFHTTKKVKMGISPDIAQVRLRVVDKDLKFELPDAIVDCEYIGRKGFQHSVDTTDASGCVMINDARTCSDFKSIRVSAEGYADTLLTHLQVVKLLEKSDGYIIPLRPLKSRFTYYVKNKFTKEPIPDAHVEVTLTLNGKTGVVVGRKRTNVDGLGQGFYDKARLLAKVDITASKKPNYKTGKLEGDYTVGQFCSLPDSSRVVWLEPEPHTAHFLNVDTLSNQPIAGVRNEIVINGIDGSVKKYVETSNRNGYFPVTAMTGDKITIVSSLDPYYHQKTTIIKKFEKKETIYMHPVLVSLVFRTMESDGEQIIGLLPNCDLTITIDGNPIQPDNSGNGICTVSDLRLSSSISIVASKQYYNSNDTKVRNRSVYYLKNAPQDERDIPLWIRRVCGVKYSSADEKGVMQACHLHVMHKPSGRFKFTFETLPWPDEFEIWNCRPEDVNNGGTRLWKWSLTDGINNDGKSGPMGDGAPTSIWLDYSNGPYITVISTRSDMDSYYYYIVCCVDDDCDWSQ